MAHVLLTIEGHEKLTESKKNIIEMLGMPEAEDIDFEPPKLNKKIFH